jgi:hypothetical protein
MVNIHAEMIEIIKMGDIFQDRIISRNRMDAGT